MKIYNYFEGKVHSIDARETAKMYIVEKRVQGFGNHLELYKDEVATTPLEAVKKATNAHQQNRAILKNQIHAIDSDLGQLRKLERYYQEEDKCQKK